MEGAWGNLRAFTFARQPGLFQPLCIEVWEDGADDRTRTYDPRITNALLYQLSYIGAGHGYNQHYFLRQAQRAQLAGGARDRSAHLAVFDVS